jgi:cytidine deaminase
MKDEELLQTAIKARIFAQAPYSHYSVGAALLCSDGKIYTGCNVESSSFGLSLCAERVALVKALSEGEQNFDRMAVVTEGKEVAKPCGACLQLLSDYAPNLVLILGNLEGEYEKVKTSELLPRPFGKEDLLK